MPITPLHPQPRPPEPTAAEIAKSLRTRGYDPGARAVLTQARGDRPRAIVLSGRAIIG